MNASTKTLLLGAAATLLALNLADEARAQGATEPGEDNQPTERIVVTAERRTTDLQTTPIPVSVLDAQDLVQKGVERMADLQFATPSLTVNDAALTEGVNIRGIGLTSGSPRAAPGVAVYRDGVLVPQILNRTTFFDIGSVEVLRGPQGTFAGSYSTGGAMYINTRDPDLDDVNGYVTAGVGDYGSYTLGGAYNAPLSDTFAARLAFDGQVHDSYYDFINGGGDSPEPGGLEEIAGRIGLAWSPSSKFRAVLKLEGVDSEAGGRAYRPRPGSQYAPFAPADPRTLDFDTEQSVHEQVARLSLRGDYEFDNGITLRSITGGNYNFADNMDDSDATASVDLGAGLLGGAFHQVVYERTASQEFDLISPDDQRFSWVLGAYVYQTSIYVDIDSFNSPTAGGDQTLIIDIHTRKGNHGAFAHGRYDITPSLQAELGLRWSHSFTSDDGSISVLNVFGPGVDLVLPNDGHHSDEVVTGKAGLNWNLNDDNFLFAFAARGFKPGTTNGSSGILAPAFLANPGLPGAQVDPEIVDDFELGWRSTMFDGALRTQTGVFFSDYSDFQIDSRDLANGQAGGLVNAESATLYGFEGQAQLSAGDFLADFGMAYVSTEVDNATLVDETPGLVPPPGSPPMPQCVPASGPAGTPGPSGCWNYATFDVAGNNMAFAPEWTFTAGAEYSFHVGRGSTLTPRLNYSFVGEQWGNMQQRTSPPTDLIESRAILDASLSYENGDWRLRAFVNNATDELYVSGFAGPNQFFGPPRTYGVEMTKNF